MLASDAGRWTLCMHEPGRMHVQFCLHSSLIIAWPALRTRRAPSVAMHTIATVQVLARAHPVPRLTRRPGADRTEALIVVIARRATPIPQLRPELLHEWSVHTADAAVVVMHCAHVPAVGANPQR